ncbi:MAG: hypothetical protein AAB036_04970 [Elusimicrobiota bacterium]
MTTIKTLALTVILAGLAPSRAGAADAEDASPVVLVDQAAQADIPQCLEAVVNQVGPCYGEILKLAAELQTELDRLPTKDSAPRTVVGTPLAFPTQDPPGVDAVLVLVPISQQGKTVSLVASVYPITLSRGLFWRKTCRLSPATKTVNVDPKKQKSFLAETFGCPPAPLDL